MKESSRIEFLEARIAPASVSVTYTDNDGDLVKITASKPGKVAPPLDLADLSGHFGHIRQLTLTDAGFDGASIVFTVTKKGSGNGLAHVGFIDATGVDLDKVIVKGDLARIVAGDTTVTDDPGLNLLQARTMGTLGLSTQGSEGFLVSAIKGKLGALKVAGDFTDAEFNAAEIGLVFIGGDLTGGAARESGAILSQGAIGDVRIGGDVIGGAGQYSGQIYCNGAMGGVRIGGNVIGDAGEESGSIYGYGAIINVRIAGDVIGGAGKKSGSSFSPGTMGDVRIGGDVIGGAGQDSGRIFSFDTMGDVRIGGDVTGGAGESSGAITSGLIIGSTIHRIGAMGDVRIGGSLTGGAGTFSGQLGSTDTMGDVTIGGSVIGGSRAGTGQVGSIRSMGHVRIDGHLIGGSIAGDASLSDSGEVISFERIASVTIGGSFMAGSDASAGTLLRCGVIVAGDDLGPVKIGGSILGNAANPALIIAKGQEVKPAAGFDTAIASLTVGGDVRYARILGGFTLDQIPANADASIGKVTVRADWVASSLLAGTEEAGFPTGYRVQIVGDTSLLARIASIVIKGDVTGSAGSGDYFGFVAQQIDKLKIGPQVVALTTGPSNDHRLFSGEVSLTELWVPV